MYCKKKENNKERECFVSEMSENMNEFTTPTTNTYTRTQNKKQIVLLQIYLSDN